jgi:hypothetical protein
MFSNDEIVIRAVDTVKSEVFLDDKICLALTCVVGRNFKHCCCCRY